MSAKRADAKRRGRKGGWFFAGVGRGPGPAWWAEEGRMGKVFPNW